MPDQAPTRRKSSAPRSRSIECLEQSLRARPRSPAHIRAAGRGLSGLGRSANLEAAAQRLLAKFPDDLETLTLLARQYIEKNDPAAALPLVQKARALKPLDESLRELEWTVRVGLARIHALAKQWDAGRDEFKAAEQLLPDCRNQYHLSGPQGHLRGKGQRGRTERPLSRAGAGQPERPDAALARARDRVDPLRHDKSDPEGLRPALGVGAQEQMHERDRRRDGLAHGCVRDRAELNTRAGPGTSRKS